MDNYDLNKLEDHFLNEEIDTKYLEEIFTEEANTGWLKIVMGKKWGQVLKSPSENINLNHILYKIHFNINSGERRKSESKTIKFYRWVSGIAVLLVLLLSIAGAMQYFGTVNNSPVQLTQIIAPKGEKARFVLPDGSTGYLNSGSILKYSSSFVKKREVLLDGEGFFDVVHADLPFAVKVNGMTVKVHGTRFNVSGYSDDDNVIATLEEGSVSVTNENSGETLELYPGQQAVLDRKESKLVYRDVNVDLYVSWKNSILKFNNTPFADVVKKMERWYDVKIILHDELKYTQNYTMTIKTESLREMLDLIKVSTPLNYVIEGDKVYITNLKK